MGYTALKTDIKKSLIISSGNTHGIVTTNNVASPYLILNLQGEYEDNQPIDLVACTSTNVKEVTYNVEVISTEYGTCTTAINNGVLEFTSHFEGKVKIKSYATNDEEVGAEKTIDVYCTDVASYHYSVDNVVVNDGQNANATDTGVRVAFIGHKTPVYASGRLGDTEDIDVTKSITFAANTTAYDITRSGTIVWNGVNVNWSIIQVATKYIRLQLDNSYEDSSQIELSNFTDTNVNGLIYGVDVVSTEYGEFEGHIDGTKLVCAGHFDGVIKITASDEENTISAEKNVSIYCNDLVTEYDVSNIVVNGGENVAADATSVNVTFTGTTTTYYKSGRSGTTTSEQVTQSVSIEPNESSETYSASGYFDWNGVIVDWSATQDGVPVTTPQWMTDAASKYGTTVDILEDIVNNYTIIDYLQNENYAFIDTGIAFKTEHSFETYMSFVNNGSYMGSIDSASNLIRWGNTSGKLYVQRGGTGGGISITDDGSYHYINTKSDMLQCDNIKQVPSVSVLNQSGNLYIFAMNDTRTTTVKAVKANCKFFNVKTGDNYTKVLIPCINTNGDIGMIDVVSGVFVTKTQGAFNTEVPTTTLEQMFSDMNDIINQYQQ